MDPTRKLPVPTQLSAHSKQEGMKQAKWREEDSSLAAAASVAFVDSFTSKVKKALIESDLIRAFEEVALQDIDRFRLQIHLNLLAKSVSRDRVLQMRSYVRDIFAQAADQGYLEARNESVELSRLAMPPLTGWFKAEKAN
jgi:hypothetical protein